MTKRDEFKSVVVIGAGPAGIFAAETLAENGVEVALINRDIRPGGLAEYGIFHSKYKMKAGLRKQFRKALSHNNIHYFGNLSIGEQHELTLPKLKGLGFDAILVATGAQGTKWLGVSGERTKGVFHAKDLVYHYNRLPPFSERQFEIGKKVAIIGVGNVMVDIAHWLIRDLKVQEVTAIARRGAADVKFTKKEMQAVAANLDLDALDRELARIAPNMNGVDQDIEAAKAFILSGLKGAVPAISDTKLKFAFLSSPREILSDAEGRVAGLQIEETQLTVDEQGRTRPKGTGQTAVLDVDTVIFAVGDVVDKQFGLPLEWNNYAASPNPAYAIGDLSYEAYDPEQAADLDRIFLVGWAREASSGLVGAARKDGKNGARAVLAALESVPKQLSSTHPVSALMKTLNAKKIDTVSKEDWYALEQAEVAEGEERQAPHFKYRSNADMLAAIAKQRDNLMTKAQKRSHASTNVESYRPTVDVSL